MTSLSIFTISKWIHTKFGVLKDISFQTINRNRYPTFLPRGKQNYQNIWPLKPLQKETKEREFLNYILGDVPGYGSRHT